MGVLAKALGVPPGDATARGSTKRSVARVVADCAGLDADAIAAQLERDALRSLGGRNATTTPYSSSA